jgi:hypothetical protein
VLCVVKTVHTSRKSSVDTFIIQAIEAKSENVVRFTNWSHHPMALTSSLAITNEPTVLQKDKMNVKAAHAAPATASAHVQCPCGHRG